MENLDLIELKQEELREIEGGCLLDYYYAAKQAVSDAWDAFSSGFQAGYNYEKANNPLK